MGKKSREKAERRTTPDSTPQVRWTARKTVRGSGPPTGPLDDLKAVVAQREHLEVDIRQRVGRLRRAGYSWALIGDALGITRQSAQNRFGS